MKLVLTTHCKMKIPNNYELAQCIKFLNKLTISIVMLIQ